MLIILGLSKAWRAKLLSQIIWFDYIKQLYIYGVL